MSKNLFAKYYKNDKDRLQKSLWKILSLSNIVVSDT